MKKLEDLKIYLLDINPDIIMNFKLAFVGEPNIEVINSDFISFMNSDKGKEVDCIVSPANSFGEMTGGYDKAITKYLGADFMEKVKKYIDLNYYGEQPVGTSFMIETSKKDLKLIHTPTMRTPEVILDERIIYQCMRTTLMCALENDINKIVIPAFGGACGQVNPITIASMMRKAYQQIKTRKSVYHLK